MSYIKRTRGAGPVYIGGMAGVENCGRDQVWDGNVSYYGTKGQCMPRANYSAGQLVDASAYPGVVRTTGGDSGGGIEAFFKALVAPTPVAPAAPTVIYQQAPSSGISPTMLAVGGGAALLLLVLAMRD